MKLISEKLIQVNTSKYFPEQQWPAGTIQIL